MRTYYSILKLFALLFSLTFTIENVDAQIGRLRLSPLQKIEQKIARTDITIIYSRPSAKGRKIFGELVKYNEYWRTGANQNTTIEFSEDIVLGNKTVAKGKYAIMTVPSEEGWEFILYSDTNNLGVPETIEEHKIVARTRVEPKKLHSHIENLSIGIENFDNYKFDLSISWERTQILVPVKLTTRKLMDEIIARQLSGPNYADYYLAATYEFESGKNYSRGLEWINKAIEMTDEIGWWDYRIKSYLLIGARYEIEAKETAAKGLSMAKEANNNFGINEFESILGQLE